MWLKTSDGTLVNLDKANTVYVRVGESTSVVRVEFSEEWVEALYRGTRDECEKLVDLIAQSLLRKGRWLFEEAEESDPHPTFGGGK